MSATIKVERSEDVLKVSVAGKLDSATANRFGSLISDALQKPADWVVIDIENVSYVSSDGLRYFVTTSRRVAQKLVVVGMNRSVREVFRLTGLDRLMSLCVDLEAARQVIETNSNSLAKVG